MPECDVPSCTVPTHDRICRTHLAELVAKLRQLSERDTALLAELEITATRQARLASPVGVNTRGGPKPVLFHESASMLLGDVRRDLAFWGDVAAETFTHLRPRRRTAVETAGWLASIPGLLAGLAPVEDVHGGVAGMHKVFVDYVRQIWKAIDRLAEHAYLGQCSAVGPDGECERHLYAELDVTGRPPPFWGCPDCGAVHDVAYRQRVLVAAAREVCGTAVELSRICGRFGVVVPVDRIRKWKQRGLLRPVNLGEYPPLFRLADVEARLFPEATAARRDAS